MTLGLMHESGIRGSFKGRKISIREGEYSFNRLKVESDWSGASYWFMVAALLPGSKITLPGLEVNSLQGDSVLTSLFEPLGVRSAFTPGQLQISSGGKVDRRTFEQDFTGWPDLAQTCAATLCAMGIPFHFSGTRTLRLKETDRIAALQRELGKLGFLVEADEDGDWIRWDGRRTMPEQDPVITTYNDHRMALAFAPLSIPFGRIAIASPLVVSKSYPAFWDHLKQAGFAVK
jgi:3-phosphoshikimate 1-carboxyvinyltransferase